MCTIGRTPAGTAGKAHHRTDPAECTVRGGQERTDCGSKRGRNSFLNTALPPIARESLMVETYDGYTCNGINVITRENYGFLRDSFFRYATLLDMEAVHIPGNSIGEGIARLYDEMNALVGDDLNRGRTALLPFVEKTPVGKLHAVLFPGKVSGVAQSRLKKDRHYLSP